MQHFIGQREEFETARDSILVWLTEMDLQLTNIEHFSECDVQAKIKQLRVGLAQSLSKLQIWHTSQANMKDIAVLVLSPLLHD